MAKELELQGENVRRSTRARKYPIENAVRHIEKGRREGNNLTFTDRLHLEPGSPGKILRTVEVNPVTGERLGEVGTLTEEAKRIIAEDQKIRGRSLATTLMRTDAE